MSVPMLTLPLETFHSIGLNFLPGKSVAWICPYSLINLIRKTKKNVCSYMKSWKLVNCGISTITVKSGIEGDSCNWGERGGDLV